MNKFQAYTLASINQKNDFGKELAMKIAELIQQNPKILVEKHSHTLMQRDITGLELALYTGQTDVLDSLEKAIKILEKSNFTKPEHFPLTNFPECWNEKDSVRALKIWIAFHQNNKTDALIRLLDRNYPYIKTKHEKIIFETLKTETLTLEHLLQMATWRLEHGASSFESGKEFNKLFSIIMKDEENANWLVNELVFKRHLPHALVWLLIVGEGNGFGQKVPRAYQNGLIQTALQSMATAHDRFKLIKNILKHKKIALESGKKMNEVLREALK